MDIRSKSKTIIKTLINILISSLFLIGCSNDIEEFEQALAIKKDGIYVNLSTEIQQAIALPNSQITVQLRVVDTSNGAETEQTLTINNDVASDEATLPLGEYRYHVRIVYILDGSTQEPLLLAAASKTSSSNHVKFEVGELLSTVAFDIDGDGIIDESEKMGLNFDFDMDTRSNLAEIVEFGNPRNREPTFLSATTVSVVEGFGRGEIMYTALAISPKRDSNGAHQPIIYEIPVSGTDSKIISFINIDATTGDLFLNRGQELRFYPQGINTYNVTITATDIAGSITALSLSLNVTDIFNLTVQASPKALDFQWDEVNDSNGVTADYYKLLEDIYGNGDFKNFLTQNTDGTISSLELIDTQYKYTLSLHLTDVTSKTQYRLEAYRRNIDPDFNDTLLDISTRLELSEAIKDASGLVALIGYVSASVILSPSSLPISSMALSSDGTTIAVGAAYDDSLRTGICNIKTSECGPTTSQKLFDSGAVYIFYKQNSLWEPQVYIKPITPKAGGNFGNSVALSADGNILAVGYPRASGQSQSDFGAVYLYIRRSTGWQSEIPLRASAISATRYFGQSISISPTGTFLAIGSLSAAYEFKRVNNSWLEQAYIPSSFFGSTGRFGVSVSLSANGDTLAIGDIDDGGLKGIGGTQENDCNLLSDSPPGIPINCELASGAVHILSKVNKVWQKQVSIKASDPGFKDEFGRKVVLSSNGNTLAVAAVKEGDSIGLDGTLVNDCDVLNNSPKGIPTNCQLNSGAVYLFERSNGTWPQQLKLKALNIGAEDYFGSSIAISSDNQTLAVGSPSQDSVSAGIQSNFNLTPGTMDPVNRTQGAGAIYVYQRNIDNIWEPQPLTHIKAPKLGKYYGFGGSFALNADASVMVVAAPNFYSSYVGMGLFLY